MDEALLDAYRRTAYRVRLRPGGTAVIRIDQPLPDLLRPLAGAREWGLLTAWNPQSRPQPAAANRAAQRRLLGNLRALSDLAIHPAVGVGTGGWREPSVWVVGIDDAELDALGERYRQQAWLYGRGSGPAQLRLHG